MGSRAGTGAGTREAGAGTRDRAAAGAAGGIAGGAAGGALGDRAGTREGGAGDRQAAAGDRQAGRTDRQGDRSETRDTRQGDRSDKQETRQGERTDRQGERSDTRDTRQNERTDRQGERQEQRTERQENWQDFREQSREDRQDFMEDNWDEMEDLFDDDDWWGGDCDGCMWGLAGFTIGMAIASVPNYYYPVPIGGVSYYYYGGVYYAPASSGTGYVVVDAPVGAQVEVAPPECHVLAVDATPYCYFQGSFYTITDDGYYAVVAAPKGAVVPSLPTGAAPEKLASGLTVYKYNGVTYEQVYDGGNLAYKVVT